MTYSVLLPVREGAATLPALLAALRAQKAAAPLEILSADSGSRDGSPEILRRAGARVIEISPADFSHGGTRNLLASQSRGEFLFLLSQDAVPEGEDYLEALLRPLRENPAVAGAFARQIPRPRAGALERLRWRRSPAGAAEARLVRIESPRAFHGLPPAARRGACEFHSAACVIRRAVWEKIPFPDVPIGEDVAWARLVLLAGHALAFEPKARVRHSHHRPLAEEYARIRREAALEWNLFSYAPVRSPAGALAKGLAWGAADAAAILLGGAGGGGRLAGAGRALAFGWARALALRSGYRAALAGR